MFVFGLLTCIFSPIFIRFSEKQIYIKKYINKQKNKLLSYNKNENLFKTFRIIASGLIVYKFFTRCLQFCTHLVYLRREQKKGLSTELNPFNDCL